MTNGTLLIGQANQEQIDKWKAEVKQKYGENAKVMFYKVDGRICYFRSVDRDTYAAALAKFTSNPAQFSKTVIEQTWLGGDMELRTIDHYYLGLIDFVEEILNKKKGELGEC
jgi:hypothetical protein